MVLCEVGTLLHNPRAVVTVVERDRDLDVVEWTVTDGQAVLVLLRPDPPGDPAPLADELAGTLAMPGLLAIRYMPETVSEATRVP